MKTTAQRMKKVRSFKREIEKWFDADAEALRTGNEKDILNWLTSDQPRAAVVAAQCLEFIGFWYGQNGAKAILNGDAQGWVDLDRKLAYSWWYLRIADRGLLHQANCAAAHALIFGDDRMAGWLIHRMVRSLGDEKPGLLSGFGPWYFSAFAPFLIHLWAIHTDTEVPLLDPAKEVAGLGVYGRVLDAWNDLPALAKALENACDYHLDQATYSDNDLEFMWPPYDLFPIDILAVARVRQAKGLPMPEVDHPLMQTPLAKPPPNDVRPRMPADPLLDAVIEKARKQGFLPPGDPFAID